MSRLNELRMIARVAQMYHTEGMLQSEIARTLRISQATISRILKKAQNEGLIRTTIVSPPGTYTELERSLRHHFDLPEAVIVECSEDRDGAIMARIGEAAAHFVETTLQVDEVIGVSSWSETVQKMVDNIHPTSPRSAKYVVQVLGGMGNPSVQTYATQMTARLAQLTGAEPQLVSAPGVAQSREAKLIMVGEQYVRETMDLYGQITLAIVGIGAVEPSHILARSGNVFSAKELSGLVEAGAVGDMCLRFFDSSGKPVQTPLNDRVIGITMEQLAKADRVIGLAGGQSKTSAIYGALRTGILDVLITDKFTAQRLLQLLGEEVPLEEVG